MTPTPSGSEPDLLEVVRGLATEHHVFGELGRRSDEDVWFLGRRHGDSSLVALRLQQTGTDEWGDPRYEMKVARELGSEVPTAQSNCHECGAQLRTFARFCGQCGADQTKGQRTSQTAEEQRLLLEEVRKVTEEHYEVLGVMPQAEGGGVVYFALERSSRELVRLRLRESSGGMELGETQVGIGLDSTITATPMRPLPVIRRSTPASRPTPLGVTEVAPAEPEPQPQPVVPPDPPARASAPIRASRGPSDRERMLTIAVIVLAALVMILMVLLLRR
ncbi:MAG: zinc ribbon domain-containing protein [Gemmatimonadales bacterium]